MDTKSSITKVSESVGTVAAYPNLYEGSLPNEYSIIVRKLNSRLLLTVADISDWLIRIRSYSDCRSSTI